MEALVNRHDPRLDHLLGPIRDLIAMVNEDRENNELYVVAPHPDDDRLVRYRITVELLDEGQEL